MNRMMLGLVAALTLAGCGAPDAPASADPDEPRRADVAGTTVYVAPDGKGPCTAARPCGSLEAAMRRVPPGRVVEMASGTYPRQSVPLTGRAGTDTAGVIVRPAPGSRVVVDGIVIHQPNVTVRGIESTGRLHLAKSAKRSRLEAVTVTGDVGDHDAVLVEAHDAAVVGSTIVGNIDDDAVKVSASGVLIAQNLIGPAARGGDGGHVDCLQVMAGRDLRIHGNVLRGCSNSAVFLKPDKGPIEAVSVENNFVQGCLRRNATCAGHFALYVEEADGGPIADVRIVHNTIDGAVKVDGRIPGLVVAANIIGRLDTCGPFARDNLLAATRCDQLTNGNERGAAGFRDRAAGDLHLTAPSPSSGATSEGSPTDIDGEIRRCSPPDRGADQRPC